MTVPGQHGRALTTAVAVFALLTALGGAALKIVSLSGEAAVLRADVGRIGRAFESFEIRLREAERLAAAEGATQRALLDELRRVRAARESGR